MVSKNSDYKDGTSWFILSPSFSMIKFCVKKSSRTSLDTSCYYTTAVENLLAR